MSIDKVKEFLHSLVSSPGKAVLSLLALVIGMMLLEMAKRLAQDLYEKIKSIVKDRFRAKWTPPIWLVEHFFNFLILLFSAIFLYQIASYQNPRVIADSLLPVEKGILTFAYQTKHKHPPSNPTEGQKAIDVLGKIPNDSKNILLNNTIFSLEKQKLLFDRGIKLSDDNKTSYSFEITPLGETVIKELGKKNQL